MLETELQAQLKKLQATNGVPPKIPKMLNLNTHIYHDQKTLVLLDNQDSSVNWSKWGNIVIGMDGYRKWVNKKTHIVGIIMTSIQNSEEAFNELFKISKNVAVIYVSQDVLSHKTQEYWTDNYDNLILLDDTCNTYPYIQSAWNGNTADAMAIMAMIMRYNIVVFPSNGGLYELSEERKQILDGYGISVKYDSVPNECWLFLQYFKHSINKRYREIRECLRKNCENELIDRIVLITEKDYSQEWSKVEGNEKIQQIVSGERLTYSAFLRSVTDVAPDNCYVILANADIYFGTSLKHLWSVDMRNKMLALLRWDVTDVTGGEDKAKMFGPRTDSQDSWIFLSDSIKKAVWNYDTFNYQLGKPGCDNRFTSDVLRKRFLISNPSLTIKSFHLHNSEVRNYTNSEYIPSDVYLFIEPTRILDMKQTSVPQIVAEPLVNDSVEFEVKSSSVSNGITYCTMLGKEERFKWEPSVENFYMDQIPLYKWKNASVSTNGLVYDLWNIYTGKHMKTHDYWKDCNVDIFTPLERRERMLAIPFKDNSVFEKPDTYCLEYLSRVARLLKGYPGYSFWVPREFLLYVQQFKWKSSNLGAIPYDPSVACYADEVIGFLPGPYELGKEDITALRELYPGWIRKPIEGSCVVITDSVLTEDVAMEIEKQLYAFESRIDWCITVVDGDKPGTYNDIIGAQICIFVGGKDKKEKWSRLWALPTECCVIEFQIEKDIDGEFQHLAHVSELNSWVYLLGRGSKKDMQQKILEGFQKWYEKNCGDLVSMCPSYNGSDCS